MNISRSRHLYYQNEIQEEFSNFLQNEILAEQNFKRDPNAKLNPNINLIQWERTVTIREKMFFSFWWDFVVTRRSLMSWFKLWTVCSSSSRSCSSHSCSSNIYVQRITTQSHRSVALSVNKCVSVSQPSNRNKMLSYRRETALQGALQFSPKVEDWNWDTIFYGHYRSIFNHCDKIGLKICRIPWKKAK